MLGLGTVNGSDEWNLLLSNAAACNDEGSALAHLSTIICTNVDQDLPFAPHVHDVTLSLTLA